MMEHPCPFHTRTRPVLAQALSPKKLSNPALSRSSVPSIAIPSRIASQATRRSVAPRFEDAEAGAFWVGASLRVSSSILQVTHRTHWPILGHAFPVLPHSYYRYVAAPLLHILVSSRDGTG